MKFHAVSIAMRAHHPAHNGGVRRGQPPPRTRPRHTALTVALLLALGVATPTQATNFVVSDAVGPQPNSGVTLLVTSCSDDSTGGTLREVVATAVDGDTVDLSALSCSTITLTQGAIAVAVDNLILLGPSANTLTIDGASANRVLAHSGTGTLAVTHLGVAHGKSDAYAGGGCIFSTGGVVLNNATVSHCTAGSVSNGVSGYGAGIFAVSAITLVQSTVSDNAAVIGGSYGYGSGGGVFSRGDVQVTGSTVSGNSGGWGGGVGTYGSLQIESSTISGNTGYGGGGICAGETAVSNSTISGNTSHSGGGIRTDSGLSLRNSTVAFNTAVSGGGVLSLGGELDVTSSIVSNNTSSGGTYANDLGGTGFAITGSHNVIMSADANTPGDTLTDDPGLQQLANNGGPTRTHALGSASIAINAGLNPDALAFDQRGNGFARTTGITTDIGAFEGDSERIFMSGFE